MGLAISVDKTRDLTVFTAQGELSVTEQLDALHEFYNGAPTPNVIWDFRLLKGNRISSDELYTILLYIKQHENKRNGGKTALVAATDLDYGISRAGEIIAEIRKLPWQTKAFRSMQDALDWIDGKELKED